MKKRRAAIEGGEARGRGVITSRQSEGRALKNSKGGQLKGGGFNIDNPLRVKSKVKRGGE